MSVLINMEMPTSCADCRLMADGWCYSVGLKQREKISTVKRPTWCPLVPVPPHGRLIDADALKQKIFSEPIVENADDPRFNLYAKVQVAGVVNKIIEAIDDAPTIIQAEEGET